MFGGHRYLLFLLVLVMFLILVFAAFMLRRLSMIRMGLHVLKYSKLGLEPRAVLGYRNISPSVLKSVGENGDSLANL